MEVTAIIGLFLMLFGLLIGVFSIAVEMWKVFAGYVTFAILLLCWAYHFESKPYLKHFEKELKVSIAENGSAYVYLPRPFNVNDYFGRNFKDGDVIIQTYYPGFWSGFVYKDQIIQYSIKEKE